MTSEQQVLRALIMSLNKMRDDDQESISELARSIGMRKSAVCEAVRIGRFLGLIEKYKWGYGLP